MVLKENFKFEIICSLRRLHPLFESKILWEPEDTLFRQSVYIEVLIRLNDLLEKSKKIEKRISFVDDIKVGDKISDITDLIKVFRDCVCHMDTDKRKFGERSYAFVELRGKTQYKYDSTIECLYEDEIAFIMGGNVLYLKRHIERTFVELKQIYAHFLGQVVFNFSIKADLFAPIENSENLDKGNIN